MNEIGHPNSTDIVTTDNPLEILDDDVVEVGGKVLYVTPETEGVDFSRLIAKAAQLFDIGNVLAGIGKDIEYVVQIPLKYQDALKKGELFIMQNQKNGKMWPTLMRKLENGKNQIVDPLPIKERNVVAGNPFHDLAQGYHNLYMQQQLGELANKMANTYRAVKRIEQGQMDDRIAKLMSGRDQIILAMELPDEMDKRLALTNGRSEIVTAQKQILQTLKRRVESFPEELPEGEFKQLKLEIFKKGTLEECVKTFEEAQDYYELYLQATDMLAASYIVNGDLERAELTYRLSMDSMNDINFDRIKTLNNVQGYTGKMFYDCAVEYIEAERELCLEQAKEYDYIQIAMTGKQLLEEFGNVREKEISETEPE